MKLLPLLLLLVVSTNINAQQTYVPDNNFEAFLESSGMGNGIPGDNYVTTANISGVTSLGVWNLNIADLTGIDGFTSLTSLFCYTNNLTTLDLSSNFALTDVRCYSNQLTSINVSNCTALSTLLCYDNPLLSLDVTNNTNLSDLRCNNSSLTSLDVTMNPALSVLFCYNSFLTAIDVTQNSNLTNFRCFNNNLTALNVTQNANMSTLFCYDNQLAALDVTQNSALALLFCFDNQITELDVTQNGGLMDLRCNDNLLTSLDASQNPLLTLLWCYDNQLTCLNANNGQNLTLDCTNNQLTCVEVVYPPYAAANASFDASVTFDVVCEVTMNNDVISTPTTLTAEQNNATYQWIDCDVLDGVISGAADQSYSPVSTGYYAVIITLADGCGTTLIDTSSCHLVYIDETSSLDELQTEQVKLTKITDLMGRDTEFKPNTPLIYIYSDGTIKKVFTLED
ncbi:MAG: hypothetical protein P8H56_01315 [Crocinitomicaceae bacterium]|nr:hypothetical protein [Crocinitomicaceae bacterium]MDG1657199.1 hypothetical protein [Crocinitomicaceae bacterium]